jgi:hypothetical protein
MGVDIYTNIRVYVKCRSSLKKEKIAIICCNNYKCKEKEKQVSSSQKYCAFCGSILGAISKYIETEAVDQFSVVDNRRMNSVFSINDKNYDYYVSNVENDCPLGEITIESKYSNSFACEIDYKKIPEQIEWFKKTFSKEIKKLEKAYGPKNVEICFGVIHEVS